MTRVMYQVKCAEDPPHLFFINVCLPTIAYDFLVEKPFHFYVITSEVRTTISISTHTTTAEHLIECHSQTL